MCILMSSGVFPSSFYVLILWNAIRLGLMHRQPRMGSHSWPKHYACSCRNPLSPATRVKGEAQKARHLPFVLETSAWFTLAFAPVLATRLGAGGLGHTPAASCRDGAALAWCYRGAAGWAGLIPGSSSPMEVFMYGNGKGRRQLGAEGKGKWSHITPRAAGLPADQLGDTPSKHFPMTVGGT